jgi:hypothetical protein
VYSAGAAVVCCWNGANSASQGDNKPIKFQRGRSQWWPFSGVCMERNHRPSS